MPKISVLIPVFNAASTLDRAIQSILKQSFSDFEIILINNGSTDETTRIINSFNDARIKKYSLESKDLIAALNFGLKQCAGKYIARMDADDYSYPYRLEIQSRFLDENMEVGLISGLVNYIGNDNKNIGYASYVTWVNSIRTHEAIYLSRFQESALPHPSVMFRKSLIEEHGEYKDGIPEDFELWNRWLSKGIKMAKINKPILDWYDSDHRLSRVNERYSPSAFAKVKAEYFKNWFTQKFQSSRPDLYVFGYSKVLKQKTAFLTDLGLEIKYYLDVKKTSSPYTLFFKEIEKTENVFILSYVSDRKGKNEIKEYLLSINKVEGEDFLIME